MQKALFDGSLRASASETNRLQTHLDFIFTDFAPNKNKQGVREKEADNILRTGVNQPIKVDFRRGKINDHPYSIPVGPITSMEKVDDKIVAHAILWKDEFKDLAEHLEKASASDGGIQFSWELYYADKTIDDDGYMWLDDVVVAGATIVANPAYGGRTPLLALASEDDERIQELERQVANLQSSHNRSTQSMDPMDELKQQVADLATQVADLATKLTEPHTDASDDSEQQPDVAALQSELDALRTFKAETEQHQARAALLTTRRSEMKDVLTGDEFDTKSDFIAALNDEQFKTFRDTLVAAAQKSQKAGASFRFNMPDPISGNDNPHTIESLAEALRAKR